MTYYLNDGTPFVLAHHTLDEWADARREQLLRVGCSETFARRFTRRIRQATTTNPKEAGE